MEVGANPVRDLVQAKSSLGLRPHGHDLGFLARAESLDLVAEPGRGSTKRTVSQVGVTLGRGWVSVPEKSPDDFQAKAAGY